MERLRAIIEELREGYLDDKEYFGLELIRIIQELEAAEAEIKLRRRMEQRAVNVAGSISQSIIITGDK